MKSPTSATRRAFGAQTAQRTPSTPSTLAGRTPSHASAARQSPSRRPCSASAGSSGPNAYVSATCWRASGHSMSSW
ncbi:hypothetical protein WJ966_02020 [Achromobacter xylosoxidans]